MAKFHLPALVSCADVRRKYKALRKHDLSAEWRGRVEGHLLTCTACAVAFTELSDTSLGHPHEGDHTCQD